MASSKPARSRRPKPSKSKGRNRPKVQSSRSSHGGAETEATALRRELHETLRVCEPQGRIRAEAGRD
jgi:hypothetical protein